jgi:hypothetical protein
MLVSQELRAMRILAVTAFVLGALAGASAADARVASCDDIVAARRQGLTTEAIRRELTTTAARIEGCARLAAQESQQETRRGHARARRNARVGVAR